MRSNVPSDTAILIARGILLSARDGSLSPLVAPGEEAALRRMLGDKATRGWFGMLERGPWGRRCLMAAERLFLGGIFAHYLARKRWIERELRRGLQTGIRQVVIVGAGYDTLAWRLRDEFPDVGFFEIDHPATQAPKRDALGQPANLHFLSADLSEELPADVLARDPRFNAGESAVVIAEGLTMYFEAAQVSALLRSSASAAGRNGRVIFTFMEAADDGSIGFRGESKAVGWWLRLRREPFLWGSKRADLAGFVAAAGLHLEAVAGHHDLRREILRPLGSEAVALARGECLCLCHPSLS